MEQRAPFLGGKALPSPPPAPQQALPSPPPASQQGGKALPSPPPAPRQRSGPAGPELFGKALLKGTVDGWTALWLAFLYVAFSASLAVCNNYLISPGRFPHPTHLAWAQSLAISVCAAMLYAWRPMLFPALSGLAIKNDTIGPSRFRRITVDTKLMLNCVLPVAALLAGTLVLSNSAYLYSSMVFLQIMREGGMAFAYLFTLVLPIYPGPRSPDADRVRVMMLLLLATAMAIGFERHFSLMGFAFQSSSIICESARSALQSSALAERGWRLDTLSYLLLVTPACMVMLTLAVACKDLLSPFSMEKLVAGPAQLQDALDWGPYIFANAMLAFLTNLLYASLLEFTTVLGFVVAGVVRDCLVVLTGVILFRESFAELQIMGFFLQLVGIVTYALMTTLTPPQETAKDTDDGSIGKQQYGAAEDQASGTP